MNIPKQVKIGGITYKVNVTDNIKLGLDYGGELFYTDQQINIRPMAKDQMTVSFLHECVHKGCWNPLDMMNMMKRWLMGLHISCLC